MEMSRPRARVISKSHKCLSVEGCLVNLTVQGSPQEESLQVSFTAF